MTMLCALYPADTQQILSSLAYVAIPRGGKTPIYKRLGCLSEILKKNPYEAPGSCFFSGVALISLQIWRAINSKAAH